MERVWHPYWKWECFIAGMWSHSQGLKRREYLRRAIEFTGDAALYGSFMRRVAIEWPVTCEHHLTDTGSNRRAFIGHAAATMAIGAPEDVTRQAWAHLTGHQQDEANYQADLTIEEWEKNHARTDRTLLREVV